jgi:glutamate carboxypeptidase
MILESNRYAKPASKTDFENLTWMGGNSLMAEARSNAPSLAQEFAAFVQGMDATGPWTPLPVLLAASHPHDRDAIVGAIERIVHEYSVEGTSASIRIIGEFRPLKQSPQAKALFDQYVANARDAGLNVGGEFSGGCADSGFAAAVGAPTVCGTGPVGGKVHSPEEFLELSSIVPRAQAPWP